MFNADKKTEESTGATPSATVENNGSGPVGLARSEIAQETQARKRGRPPGSGNKNGGSASGLSARKSAEEEARQKIMADLEKLFAPEVWTPLVSMPSDAMLAITGNGHWNLSSEEKKGMAASVSTAARYMAITDPKWLAVSLAMINVFMVYAPRTIKEFAVRREEKKAEKLKHTQSR